MLFILQFSIFFKQNVTAPNFGPLQNFNIQLLPRGPLFD